MESEKDNLPITRKGLKFLLIGVIMMICGYVLMAGGGVKDPQVFNYDMFDFRRLVAAPVVIICGIIVIVAAIMHKEKEK